MIQLTDIEYLVIKHCEVNEDCLNGKGLTLMGKMWQTKAEYNKYRLPHIAVTEQNPVGVKLFTSKLCYAS